MRLLSGTETPPSLFLLFLLSMTLFSFLASGQSSGLVPRDSLNQLTPFYHHSCDILLQVYLLQQQHHYRLEPAPYLTNFFCESSCTTPSQVGGGQATPSP
jgi:hypothetical protein